MEYINGFTLAEYMRTIKLTKIKNVAEILLSIIPNNMPYEINAKNIIMAKTEDIMLRIDKNQIVYESFEILKDYNWNYLQASECHGDLTLENILISREDLYLIDFLDTFYSSWQIDVAKILQDIELFWSYRNEKIDNNLLLRLSILKKTVLSKIIALKGGYNIIESIYHLLLLNLLRIIPYSKDELTSNFLQKSLFNINKKIKDKKWRILL
jgi:hypothetical protein